MMSQVIRFWQDYHRPVFLFDPISLPFSLSFSFDIICFPIETTAASERTSEEKIDKSEQRLKI